ncbi:MAG: BatD family protein [Candidatus Babeliales bacterium]
MEKLGKIVGKLFLFILFLPFFVSLHAQITLRAIDNAGNDLQQVGVGEPFVLEVEVMDGNNSTQVPTIIGLDRFFAKRTGLYMCTINGQSTVKYSYQVRIDRVGSYEIGPAVITDHKKKQSSNIINVVVGKQSIKQKTTTQKKGRGGAKQFLRLLVEKDNVVVGQKIPSSLRFYFNNNALELKQVGKPELSTGEVKNIQGAVKGTEIIDGAIYNYVEWRWDFYPSQSGKIIIPAYSIDFDVQPKRTHALDNFSILFGPRAERKRVYSNSVDIQVDPLPPHDGSIQAVGHFKKMEAHVKPAVVKEGEAMVLTIDLEGDGNLEMIEIPELTKLPNQLKYYKSNSILIEPTTKTNLPKKRFEFIVQGINCGEWEIPSQLFTYFDVQERSYKTLKTVPLTVTIIPSTANSLSSAQSKLEKKESKEQKNSIYPINQQGQWYPKEQKEPLNWVLFGFLGIIPIGFWFFQLLWIGLTRYWFRDRLLWWQKKKTFHTARKHLQAARKKQDLTQVYNIFIILISKCCSVVNTQISSFFIKEQLCKKELPENIVSMWDNFFTHATEYAFMINEKNQFSSEAFFKQAEQWINRFEELEW